MSSNFSFNVAITIVYHMTIYILLCYVQISDDVYSNLSNDTILQTPLVATVNLRIYLSIMGRQYVIVNVNTLQALTSDM